jgi:hypothetical protein
MAAAVEDGGVGALNSMEKTRDLFVLLLILYIIFVMLKFTLV